MFLRLRYMIARSVGNLLSRVPFNVLEKREIDGVTHFLKKRHWYATPLIFVGNVYLKTLRTHIRILSRRKWLKWEYRVYKEILGKEPQFSDHNALILPLLEGRTLSDILRSENESDVNKIEAIGMSIRAIATLHKRQIIWPDGERRSFSHGDATIENIVCDRTSKTCYIIDYETIHDEKMPSEWRSSDDLRAIIYTAAKYIEPYFLNQLCRTTIRNYKDKAVLAQLKDYIEMLIPRPNVYHLAQNHLGFEKKTTLDAMLLRELESTLSDSDCQR